MALVDAVRAFFSDAPHEPTPCLCGRPATDQVVAVTDRYGLPLRLVLCGACGLIRQDPQPDRASLGWFYDGPYAGLHHRNLSLEGMAWKGERVAACAGTDHRSVVDIGCGGGWSLLPFRGAEVCRGYDWDGSVMCLGRRVGLDLRPGGAAEAAHDLQGRQADLVILSHVLEHAKQPQALLADLRPVGRTLYVELPHLSSVDGDPGRYWQLAHLWDFQPGHVEALLRRTGWAPVRVSTTEAVIQVLAQAAEPAGDVAIPDLSLGVEMMLAELGARWKRSPRRLIRAASRGLRQVVGKRG